MNRGALAQMKAGTSNFHILHSIFSLLKNKEPVSLMNVEAVISNINLRKFQPLKFLIFKYFVWWNGEYSQSTSASNKILCLSQEEILVHMLKWQTEVATFSCDTIGFFWKNSWYASCDYWDVYIWQTFLQIWVKWACHNHYH